MPGLFLVFWDAKPRKGKGLANTDVDTCVKAREKTDIAERGSGGNWGEGAL